MKKSGKVEINVKVFTVLWMVISLLGCNPRFGIMVKSAMYPGPERPADEIAVIKGGGAWVFWVFGHITSLAGIHMVDGQLSKTDERKIFHASRFIPYVDPSNYWGGFDVDEVQVPPGPHGVVIRISKWIAVVYPFERLGTRLLIFNFDTLAGHTYKVDLPIYWSKGSAVRIIDEATKEVVASQEVDWYAKF